MATDSSQRERVAVVTGATSGIGRATAEALLRDRWRVVAVGRNEAKLASLQVEDGGAVETERADLSRVADNLALARRLGDRLERIDALVCNVGAVFPERGTTGEGLERTFALNHVGPHALTTRLHDRLATSGARVVVVSSQVHAACLDIEDLQGERAWDGMAAYRASKLCNLLFAFEAARRWSEDGITVNALHPGVVDTGLLTDYARAQQLAGEASAARPSLRGLARAAARRLVGAGPPPRYPGTVDAQEGARTSVFLARDPSVASTTGHYFVNCRPAEAKSAARDTDLAHALWERTEAIVTRFEERA